MCAIGGSLDSAGPWSLEEAQDWGKKQTWRVGCNFTPSTAVNQLEFWQADSFDVRTLDRELGWMHAVGMSVARVYLHDLVYEHDPAGFKQRLEKFLKLADKHKIKIMFVFFDDCWNDNPKVGPQPSPVQGVHNSGWVQSPGKSQRSWPKDEARLKTYIQDILKTHGRDDRVWMWDLYNEPSNSGYGESSAHLVRRVFEWAWAVRPSQPLTVGGWLGGGGLDTLAMELSDVTSFHCYGDLDEMKRVARHFGSTQRPLVCTEWMARTNKSLIATHLPFLKEQGITCMQWGFVSGKTNTIFPWGSKPGTPEPELWFHDLLRANGEPFDKTEVELYQRLTGRSQ